ncbi:MAG TPA: type 1 glutamine amidotransferase domain-containing protein [Pirellula sp.]|nr:type 1 glutamine amidotransferase domain-containing protein [Pirellula sp.]
MNTLSLYGKKIAFLATDGFEQVELTEPWNALKGVGAEVELISPGSGKIRGVHHDKPGDEFLVDVVAASARAEDYDGLVLPGGVFSPDALRLNEDCVRFVRSFFDSFKPVAAICHGPWMLIEARVVEGRQLTSWPSLRTDLINAGAIWVDQACICDQGLVTSRSPNDLPVFCEMVVEEFAKGIHAVQPFISSSMHA